MGRKRFRIEIFGRVQGVGFRQATWNMARNYQIAGWVRNSENHQCVQLEAEGEDENILRFLDWIREGPTLARVDHVTREEISIQGNEEFNIR